MLCSSRKVSGLVSFTPNSTYFHLTLPRSLSHDHIAQQDLLAIGNQSRPRIFDLNIRRAPPLYSAVLEIDERVTLVGYTSDPHATKHAVQFDDEGRVSRAYSGDEGEREKSCEVIRAKQ